MGQLSANQIFTLKVKSIEPNFDSYSSISSGGMMHCHKFIFVDDVSEEYIGQWCNEFPTVSQYSAGDLLKIQVKSFKKGIHNFIPMEKMNTPAPKPKEASYEPLPGNGIKQGEPLLPSQNPNIAGTMIDRAMTLAITYWKGNEVPYGKVTDKADEILEWFRNKYNNQ